VSARQPANGRAQADPETERERQRRYYAANRDKIIERVRRYREANRDQIRQQQRRYREANRDQISERQRRRYTVNRDQINETRRQDYNPARTAVRRLHDRHGLDPADWARFWVAQRGRCYLCGERLPDDKRLAALDHDHRCCPPHRSCPRCQRGLAHGECNSLIGLAGDDPAVLRRIARNLDRARRRYEQAPEPLTLFSLNGHRAEPPTLFDLEEP
jgi:hypothetical protein